MICKIIPIKQSRGIQDCWQYIADENKVISIQKNEDGYRKATIDTSLIGMTAEEYMIGKMDFYTVLNYMENDKKTFHVEDSQKKYISGYLCHPKTAVDEFLDVREKILEIENKSPDAPENNYAFHIIQSFPENLDISDDEVHQCGRELCEKLGVHQAVICSHVHPVIDEEGEVSGKCKHNHILINSYIHPEKIDPEKPNVHRYHDNKASYAQLREWNDEIAIAHGLPIIREPEKEKKYSWYKSREENKGTSWTKQVARDIKNTMRFCANWEEFKAQMTEQGYHIRETDKTITYYTPNHTEEHKQRIREKGLGREFTKEALQNYWKALEKAEGQKDFTEKPESKVSLLEELIDKYNGRLFAAVRCDGRSGPYYLDVPLQNHRRELILQTIHTYFEADKSYQISTTDHISIAEVTGQDLIDYYEKLSQKREQEKQQTEPPAEKKNYFSDNRKRNSQTGQPYRVSRWDSTGRPRTNIELLCILARVIITKEHSRVQHPYTPAAALKFKDQDGKVIYASTDWKLQNMYNTMVMAREMGLENSADVEKKLDRAGKEVARKRKQLKSLTEQYNQMKTINDSLEKMSAVKDVCEEIYNMPDGPAKDTAIQAHAAELEQYTAAKRYLHTKNISTEAQIEDFENRYLSVSNHLEEVEKDLEMASEEYRNLKKIEYNITMAQNNYYCYGPNHPSLSGQTKDQQSEDLENINLE